MPRKVRIHFSLEREKCIRESFIWKRTRGPEVRAWGYSMRFKPVPASIREVVAVYARTPLARSKMGRLRFFAEERGRWREFEMMVVMSLVVLVEVRRRLRIRM